MAASFTLKSRKILHFANLCQHIVKERYVCNTHCYARSCNTSQITVAKIMYNFVLTVLIVFVLLIGCQDGFDEVQI